MISTLILMLITFMVGVYIGFKNRNNNTVLRIVGLGNKVKGWFK